jgi:hypothetical protein
VVSCATDVACTDTGTTFEGEIVGIVLTIAATILAAAIVVFVVRSRS